MLRGPFSIYKGICSFQRTIFAIFLSYVLILEESWQSVADILSDYCFKKNFASKAKFVIIMQSSGCDTPLFFQYS